MKTKFDWDQTSNLPDISQDALKNYFLYALDPGSFLTSLLCNDPWSELIVRADHWNKTRLHEYLIWLEEVAPPNSWGSRNLVKSWLNKGPEFEKFQKTVMWEALNASHTEMR